MVGDIRPGRIGREAGYVAGECIWQETFAQDASTVRQDMRQEDAYGGEAFAQDASAMRQDMRQEDAYGGEAFAQDASTVRQDMRQEDAYGGEAFAGGRLARFCFFC